MTYSGSNSHAARDKGSSRSVTSGHHAKFGSRGELDKVVNLGLESDLIVQVGRLVRIGRGITGRGVGEVRRHVSD